ncbi:haloalkane dehalogenase [Pseudoteredinibacter isoporae]|uniref:Haloalkane dehalogenase n=1 Tax=Pseudoteredinibacter isoporae TaxID=570281 RepID=A0A7X0JRA9_9GAMM|nr:haloalkane dehalogenase [Pseudoteredinibacter isoporae]MBB6520208.1 haloalkane dehalogenase [Pseudoteredinibacter isoporae]NHO85780.1 haloalkane dehalogenase [Pseudoteredinibacter isoporae]NIB25768.1 haloalkane dehalogenase [Pseudoteredinibacter isoporae]
MEYLRTPDECFDALPDFPYQANYLNVDDCDGGQLRVHYLDEGPSDGDIVLLMHGEPSWCYLYRKMIPVLVGAGLRVIAPDLPGFGRSDKPSKRSDYTYQRHVNWMQSALDQLDINNITLVCQDWGGLIGLRLLAENSDRFVRAVAANTMLPTGDHDPGQAFLDWRKFSQEVPEFPVGGIISGATTTDLSPEVVAAYDAPFPDESYKEGARQFPTLVPVTPDDPASEANRAAWGVLTQWNKPFLTAFSDSDPITKGGDAVMQKLIPGCQGQQHTTIVNGGHFLQEDQGEKLAEVVAAFVAANPLT